VPFTLKDYRRKRAIRLKGKEIVQRRLKKKIHVVDLARKEKGECLSGGEGRDYQIPLLAKKEGEPCQGGTTNKKRVRKNFFPIPGGAEGDWVPQEKKGADFSPCEGERGKMRPTFSAKTDLEKRRGSSARWKGGTGRPKKSF